MQFYTDGEEHPEFICDCGHEFDRGLWNTIPDKCSKCGNPNFKTWADYGDIEVVSPNIGL